MTVNKIVHHKLINNMYFLASRKDLQPSQTKKNIMIIARCVGGSDYSVSEILQAAHQKLYNCIIPGK